LEIFSVKEWPDLEIWVWGCSRSLKMARFDRPRMTFYYIVRQRSKWLGCIYHFMLKFCL